MIDETLNSFRLTLDYLRRLVADVPDADLCRQPPGVVNHPAWVIGHLTYSCQMIGGEMGLAPWLPTEWETNFGTGSTPSADRAAYATKDELLAAQADGEARLVRQIERLSDDGLAAPLPDECDRHIFPTVGHAVLHILTSHAAVHVGQVSVWRRAAGYGPAKESFV